MKKFLIILSLFCADVTLGMEVARNLEENQVIQPRDIGQNQADIERGLENGNILNAEVQNANNPDPEEALPEERKFLDSMISSLVSASVVFVATHLLSQEYSKKVDLVRDLILLGLQGQSMKTIEAIEDLNRLRGIPERRGLLGKVIKATSVLKFVPFTMKWIGIFFGNYEISKLYCGKEMFENTPSWCRERKFTKMLQSKFMDTALNGYHYVNDKMHLPSITNLGNIFFNQTMALMMFSFANIVKTFFRSVD